MESDLRTLLVSLIERFEGLYLRPYLCPAGIPTIGLGTIRYPDGRCVSLADPTITKEKAYALAWHELESCVRSAYSLSPCLVGDSRRTAAISSFIYNLGAGAYRGSTLRKRINAQDWDGAKEQIMRWNRASGKVLRGLTRRREAEAALL